MVRLKELRKAAKLTQKQLAQKLNLDTSSISKYESSVASPSPEVLLKVAKFFDVSTDYLLGNNDVPADKCNSHKIPIFSNVSAGLTSYTAENIIGWAEISEEMTKDNEYFALVINENSMEPYIFKGDIIIVKRQSDIESGHIDIVTINNKPECKKIVKHENGINLVSYNSSYAPIFYTWDETEKNISILGEVVEIRRNLKK